MILTTSKTSFPFGTDHMKIKMMLSFLHMKSFKIIMWFFVSAKHKKDIWRTVLVEIIGGQCCLVSLSFKKMLCFAKETSHT